MVRPEAKYERIPVPQRNHGPSPRGLLSLDEAAERLNRARTTIRLWAIDGRLQARRNGRRLYVTAESVEAAAEIICETGIAFETERRPESPNVVGGGIPHAELDRRSGEDSDAASGTLSPEPVPNTEPNTEPLTESPAESGYRPWRI